MERPTFFCAACGFDSRAEFPTPQEAWAFGQIHAGGSHEGAIFVPMIVADIGAEPYGDMPDDVLESSFNTIRENMVAAGVEQGSPIPKENLLLALITQDYMNLVVMAEAVPETVVELPPEEPTS